MSGGVVVSVNVGLPREVEWHGRTVTTGIYKAPVTGRVPIEGINVAGDRQADRRVHGGPRKAVYAYAGEDYDWWAAELGRPLDPGSFGDNLTLRGVDLATVVVGETWRIGTAVLRVSEPRFPCFKLGMRMGDAPFVDRFGAARRFGSYFAIDEPGTVAAGDAAERLSVPDDRLTIGDWIAASEDGDPDGLRRLVEHALVSESWRDHARKTLARAGRVS